MDDSQLQATLHRAVYHDATLLFDVPDVDLEYHVQVFTNSLGEVEHKLMFADFQFGVVLETLDGAVVYRAHPDLGDVNAYGTSYRGYVFMVGGDAVGGSIERVFVDGDKITAEASGPIDAGGGESNGTWSWQASFTFDPGNQKTIGTGTLDVSLDTALTKDMNLYRLGSNHLANVPLVGGGFGDTGDMIEAHAFYGENDTRNFVWVPQDQPAHFPFDFTKTPGVTVVGTTNRVDTTAFGQAPIAVARKPTQTLNLEAQGDQEAILGFFYDLNFSQDAYADNIGITTIIVQGTTSLTDMTWDVYLEATPPVVI